MTPARSDGNDPPRAIATLVVGCAGDARLAAILEAEARRGEVVALVDDRDGIAAPPGVTTVEPEDLMQGGSEAIAAAWDEAVGRWLARLHPGTVDGIPLAELVWVNLLVKPAWIDRIFRVALTHQLYRRWRPQRVVVAGALPPLCELVEPTARRRGVSVAESAVAGLRRGARELAWRPLGAALGVGLMGREALRAVRRYRARRALVSSLPSSAVEPRLWLAFSGKWRQPSRHVSEAIAAPLARAGVPFGLVFENTLADGSSGPDELDEHAFLDGELGWTPSNADQAVAARTPGELARTLARWLPRSLSSIVRAAWFAGSLEVDGVAASGVDDLRTLLTVATYDLERIVEAAVAARGFLARHPDARTLVFSLAAVGEAKVVDLLAQRAGLATVDFVHAYIGEGAPNVDFRTASTVSATWTVEEARRYRRHATNPRAEGGFLPRALPTRPHARDRAAGPTAAPATVLAATNYIHAQLPEYSRRHLKHARRLAHALAALERHLGDRARVVLRPHPHEDRAAWRRFFDEAGARIALSDVPQLGDDLARSDVAIVTNSSVVIEALGYDIPLLFHRGPITEPSSLFGQVDPRRRFATGAELIAAVDEALATRDTAPERALLGVVFGPTRAPRSILELLAELDPSLALGKPAKIVCT